MSKQAFMGTSVSGANRVSAKQRMLVVLSLGALLITSLSAQESKQDKPEQTPKATSAAAPTVQSAVREQLRAGTPHGGEIPFVFGTLGTGGFGPPIPPTAEDQAVSRMAQSYWVNFAKTGDPNGTGLPPWPR